MTVQKTKKQILNKILSHQKIKIKTNINQNNEDEI
jgi:hypothetical protein